MAENVAERALPVGKVEADVFYRVLYPRLGAARPEVLVGPRHGVDAGILDIGAGRVMAVTTDPFFVVPAYGWERAAWFAVHIVASDAATTGLRPAYLTVDLNLPLAMTSDELTALWEGVDRTCRDLGIAVVTGHTGRYDNCDYPMLGGATVLAVGNRNAYVTPEMAGPGDAVIVTKGPAIETTALFGVTFPDLLAARLGESTARRAADLFHRMSVVEDAMIAVEVGVRDQGVTAMHDATERGVLGGLTEMAAASGAGMLVDLDALGVPEEVRAVSDLFGIDPYSASSEGTLLLTCRPAAAAAVIDRLTGAGIPAFHVGEMVPAVEGVRMIQGGKERPLISPEIDPFWPAYSAAMEREL